MQRHFSLSSRGNYIFFRWRRAAALVALAASTAAAAMCGSQAPTNSSSPPTAPSAPAVYTLTGVVTDAAAGRAVPGAVVSATGGPNGDHSATADGSGAYSIAGLLAGTWMLHVTASAYSAADQTVTIPAKTRADFSLQPIVVANPQCDASLWNRVHDPKRLKIVRSCQTVTGVLAESHSNDDGDIDMDLTLDPPFANLLNNGNIQKLNGNLHIEAVCQARVHNDVPDALRSCANFTGSVPIPPVGTHVQVTGTYLLDTDHGWMEIHPISVLTIVR